MRTLTVLETASVSGAGEEDFSGQDGCPAGYTGVSLYTTSTTTSDGLGNSVTGGVKGVAPQLTGKTTETPPTSTTTVRYECLKDLPAGGGSGSGASGGGGGSMGGDIAIDGNDYEWDPS